MAKEDPGARAPYLRRELVSVAPLLRWSITGLSARGSVLPCREVFIYPAWAGLDTDF
jgi:hypothetical protein